MHNKFRYNVHSSPGVLKHFANNGPGTRWSENPVDGQYI